MRVCKNFKTSFQKLKDWFKKSWGWLIAIVTAFGAGLAVTFSYSSTAYRESLRSIKNLERELDEYRKLNAELHNINQRIEARLDSVAAGHQELIQLNEQLIELNGKARQDINTAHRIIDEFSERIERSQERGEELEGYTERLRVESEKIRGGISYLEEWFKNFEQTGIDV